MWAITRAQAHNFKSFEKLDWDLTACKPLTLILGSRGAGRSNGSGKTTLFALISWVGWGQLPKKPKTAAKIIRRGADFCIGAITVKDEQGEFTIERKQTPRGSALSVSGLDERALMAGSQEAINARLGTYDLFAATSFFCGAASSFCRLGDADRKELMASMAGVARYGKASEIAKQRLDEVSAALDKANGRVLGMSSAVEELQGVKAQRLRLSMKHASVVQRTFNEHLDTVLEAADAKEKAFTELRTWTRAMHAKRKAVNEAVRANEEEIAKLEDEKSSVDVKCRTVSEKLGALRSQINTLNESIKESEAGSHPDICGTCGQRWPHEHDPDQAEKRIADKRYQRDVLRDSKASVETELLGHDEAKDKLERRIRDLKRESEELRGSIDDREYKRLLTRALEREQQCESAMEVFKDYGDTHDLDPDLSDVDDLSVRLDKAKFDLKVARESVAGLSVQLKRYEFWRKGFSRTGLPSFLIDSFVPDLTDYASSIASELTDGELVVKFNSDATRGSKSVFDVEVEYANGGEGFDTISRGEETRVDVSVLFAIRDLAAKRWGKECSQLFMDEVMDGADEAFVDAFIRLIRNRYKGRQAFVISHEPSAVSLCDGTITVKKKGGVATLKC